MNACSEVIKRTLGAASFIKTLLSLSCSAKTFSKDKLTILLISAEKIASLMEIFTPETAPRPEAQHLRPVSSANVKASPLMRVMYKLRFNNWFYLLFIPTLLWILPQSLTWLSYHSTKSTDFLVPLPFDPQVKRFFISLRGHWQQPEQGHK